jgi:hypothetical protein
MTIHRRRFIGTTSAVAAGASIVSKTGLSSPIAQDPYEPADKGRVAKLFNKGEQHILPSWAFLHPDMGRLPLNDDGVIAGAVDGKINLVQVQDSESLLFFLLCLTDQRVQYEKAPFDHPSIRVVNGFQNSKPEIEFAFEVPAVGAGGHTSPASQFPSSN